MKDRVDTEGVGHEHGDGYEEGQESKYGVGLQEGLSPVGEACHGEAADGQDDGTAEIPSMMRYL